MLSFEKSQQDPSCDSPQLIKAQKLALSDQTNLDVLPIHQTPLSNFSIRDYVLCARSKDIKTNWPFSFKSLQVCLRHGVKDILPPFQALNSSRQQSCVSNPGPCEVELVPTNRQSSPPLETDLFESSVEAEAEAAEAGPSRRKTDSVGGCIKKSRLVKLGSSTHLSLSEDIGSNYTAVSDTMVLKVCPVCKTFSSTSNTTLNAHIDQCLSGESTSKCNANWSLPRHRTKPRKIRLMTDIYATAKPCTLEDHDRRNGMNWASIQTAPVESIEMSAAEAKNHAVPPPPPPTQYEDKGIAGNVYIDSSGIKLRILSKSDDLPLASEVVEDIGPSKQLEGSKFSSCRKKRLHEEIEEHQKNVKFTHQSKKFRSRISHNSQVLEDDGKCSQAEGSLQRDDGAESSNLQRLNALGTLQRWVGSKRTALTKKANKKIGLEAFRLSVNVARKLQVEGDQPKFPDKITSSLKANRIVYPVKETESNDRKEQSHGRKRTRSHSDEIADCTIRSYSPSKRNVSVTNKWCTSTGDVRMLKPPNPTSNNEALVDKQRTGNHAGCCKGPLISPSAREKVMKSRPASVMQVTETCTSRNKSYSDRRSFTPKSKSKLILEPLAIKKSQVNLITEVDDTVACQFKAKRLDTSRGSDLEKQPGKKRNISKLSLGMDSVVAVGTSSRERNIGSKRQLSGCCNAGSKETVSSICINDDLPSNFDGTESARNEFTMHGDNIVPESLRDVAVMKYKTQPSSVRSSRNYEGLLHEGEAPNGTAEFCFVDRSNGVCNISGPNARGEGEQDSEFGLENTHPEVDPIPIPGPPGSFLPSPRPMGSEDEDFQGNSLTKTSAVRYSLDKHDMFKRDSSDSPISSKSTVYNPIAGGSERKHADTTDSDESVAVRDKVNYLGFLCATTEPPSDDAAPPPCATIIDEEYNSFNGEIEFNKNHYKMCTCGCNNDEEPCCCERKKITFQNISLSYHDPHLLRRRAVPENLAVHLWEKQPGYRADTKPNNLEAVPKMLQMKNYSSSVPENMHPPVTEDSAYANPLRGASDARMKSVGQGDSISASQSSSPNTVLRLMGKNLIVVNKDEDALMPLGQDERCAQNDHCTSQYAASTGLYLTNILHPGCLSTQDSSSTLGLCSNVRMSSEFRSQARQVETPENPSAAIVHNQLAHGSFAARLDAAYHYKDEHSTPTQEFQHDRRPYESTSYVCKNTSEMSDSVLRNADQVKLTRDIIISGDSPGYAADLTTDARNTGDLSNCQDVSSGISILPAHQNMMRANNFPCYHSLDPSRLSFHQWSKRLALP